MRFLALLLHPAQLRHLIDQRMTVKYSPKVVLRIILRLPQRLNVRRKVAHGIDRSPRRPSELDKIGLLFAALLHVRCLTVRRIVLDGDQLLQVLFDLVLIDLFLDGSLTVFG